MTDKVDYLSYKQAAEFLGFPLGTLYGLVSTNRVPHVRYGKRLVRFSRSALKQWIAKHEIEPSNYPSNRCITSKVSSNDADSLGRIDS